MANCLAASSGLRYGSTYTWVSNMMRVVCAATNPRVVIGSTQNVLIVEATDWGRETWSHTPR